MTLKQMFRLMMLAGVAAMVVALALVVGSLNAWVQAVAGPDPVGLAGYLMAFLLTITAAVGFYHLLKG